MTYESVISVINSLPFMPFFAVLGIIVMLFAIAGLPSALKGVHGKPLDQERLDTAFGPEPCEACGHLPGSPVSVDHQRSVA